jgi:predicted Rdx family selenoprotein
MSLVRQKKYLKKKKVFRINYRNKYFIYQRFSIVRVLRAGWMAQELLITFTTLIGEVALIPGSSAVFKVHLDGGNKNNN